MDPFPFPSSPIFSAYTPDAMAAHSPRNLQDHLYASFLEGSTADVALHISGSWQAIYKLHRVVLIQAVRFLHLSHCCLRTNYTAPRRCRNSSDASLLQVSQNHISAKGRRVLAVLSQFTFTSRTQTLQDQVCSINLREMPTDSNRRLSSRHSV